MIINNELLDKITVEATASPRLRQAFDLRTTPEDSSQRILNALMPGTIVPIHRHTMSAETVIIIRGSVIEELYDTEGKLVESIELCKEKGNYMLQIPANVWHTVKVNSPCVIFEAKDRAYNPQENEFFEEQN